MLRVLFLLFFFSMVYANDAAHIHTIAILKYGNPLPEKICQGIYVDPKLNVPRSEEKLIKRIFPYLLKPLRFQDLEDLENTILCYYQTNNRPLVSVVIPPQDLSDGLLQLEIVEPIADNVCYRGNRWTSDGFLIRNSSLYDGVQINSYELQNNLAWINRSPFRQTDLILSPGSQPGTTNAELITKERFPLRVYAGADNTGTVFLTHTRVYAGFNAGNLWEQDHQASFQWTTAPDPKTLTAFTGQYLAPFPWHQQLLIYGGYSKFRAEDTEILMTQQGKAWQVSSRYQIPIYPLFGALLQQVSMGYDFKRTNSELLFGGISFQEGFADINQFYFGYLLDFSTCHTKTSLTAEVIGAPFQITHDQNNHAFQKLRPYAKAKYVYGRVRFNHTRNVMHGFVARIVLAGQLTGWNLLASEQFPLGGWDTIRGYEERAFNADSGFLASCELGTPQLFPNSNHFFELLGFVDYGWGRLHKPYFGQEKKEWLLGVGPGARYRYKTNLVLRGDIGFPCHRAGVPRHGTHYYGGATLSF